jgi:hypothetical protein
MPTLVYARRGPIQYGPRVPQDVKERDEVFSLRGEYNDERLMRLGHLASVSPLAKPEKCGQCGKTFLTLGALEHHGTQRHKRSTEEIVNDAVRVTQARIAADLEQKRVQDVTNMVGDSEDRKVERHDARMEAERPIHWEKTAAAVAAGDAPVPEVSTAPARKRPTVRKEKRT